MNSFGKFAWTWARGRGDRFERARTPNRYFRPSPAARNLLRSLFPSSAGVWNKSTSTWRSVYYENPQERPQIIRVADSPTIIIIVNLCRSNRPRARCSLVLIWRVSYLFPRRPFNSHKFVNSPARSIRVPSRGDRTLNPLRAPGNYRVIRLVENHPPPCVSSRKRIWCRTIYVRRRRRRHTYVI